MPFQPFSAFHHPFPWS